jgi:hypothetical protein
MTRIPRRVAAAIGAAALLTPAAAWADKPEHAGKPDHAGKPGHAAAPERAAVPGHAIAPDGAEAPGKARRGARLATYVFKGTWNEDGSVTVAGGNAPVRKAELVGATVMFALEDARLRVADTNGDGAVDPTDVLAGDQVLVQARLPRTEPGEGPFAARKLVDRTNPPLAETEEPEAG